MWTHLMIRYSITRSRETTRLAVLLDEDLVPLLAACLALDRLHLLARLLELVAGMPGFPVSARLPGPDDHSLVDGIGGDAELHPDPALLFLGRCHALFPGG